MSIQKKTEKMMEKIYKYYQIEIKINKNQNRLNYSQRGDIYVW